MLWFPNSFCPFCTGPPFGACTGKIQPPSVKDSLSRLLGRVTLNKHFNTKILTYAQNHRRWKRTGNVGRSLTAIEGRGERLRRDVEANPRDVGVPPAPGQGTRPTAGGRVSPLPVGRLTSAGVWGAGRMPALLFGASLRQRLRGKGEGKSGRGLPQSKTADARAKAPFRNSGLRISDFLRSFGPSVPRSLGFPPPGGIGPG